VEGRWIELRSRWKPQPEDARTPFEADTSRVVHSGAFRRLQGKTQILNLGDSDFYRTRLTHSLEVAQIGCSVIRQLRAAHADGPIREVLPPETLIQTLGYAHDLGHPPFGHGGEVALNYCMSGAGGFEGNGQTLRILTRLEHFSNDCGADLTRRALLGILKYPVPFSLAANPELAPALAKGPSTLSLIDRERSKPPKCYLDDESDVVEWLLRPVSDADRERFVAFDTLEGKHAKTRHKSFDCTVLDLADDIAYGVHDLEDVVALGLVDEAKFREAVTASDCEEFLAALRTKYPDEVGNDVHAHFTRSLFGDGGWRKRFIGRLVHHFVTHARVIEAEGLEEPLLRFRVELQPAARRFLNALQKFVVDNVIRSASVQHLEFKGQRMVVSVFEAIACEPEALLPDDARAAWRNAANKKRAVCDFVAGMTDAFLLRTYERLFSPRMGSVFDKL